MKKTIICSALAILGIRANAQVEDISVTVSPTASYNWFDNNTAIKDGLMVGGRVGFAFGEYFELRGLYEKSVDLKNTVNNLDLPKELDDWKNKFESRNVDVDRWGGEMKANIPSGGYLAPYITLGTGVQTLKVDDLKDKQIYVTAGLGAKINLNDRIVLNLEGKNTAFNLNRGNLLFNEAEASSFEQYFGDDNDERMYNWSVLAGLQFYLGGRESGKLTDLDRAYLRKFSGGLSGLKLVIEPGVAYVDFNKNLPFSDTYLVGGSVGMDFSQYVGLRGFYYQATQDKKFEKFDDLSMYGGEIFARLNVARGISPYITLGGGYLNVYENKYTAKENAINPTLQDSYFVKGGVGVNVPVSKYFELFGAANLLYSTNKKAENLHKLQDPNELLQSKMYNVGVRLNLGASSNEDEILQETMEEANGNKAYKERIKELEKELKKAYKENDSDRAIRVIKEKQELENSSKGGSKVRLTPEELQDLVEKTIDEVNAGYDKKKESDSKEDTNQRIERLERVLLEVNKKDYNQYQGVNGGNIQVDATQQILSELRELNAKVDNNAARLSALNGGDKTVIVTPQGTQQVAPAQQVNPAQTTTETQVQPQVAQTEEGNTGVVKSLFVNEGLSIDAGASIGSAVSPVVGLRGHYGFTNSNFELQPSIYFGLGKKGGFGINANAIYKFNFETGPVVQPYLGLGVGYNKLDDDSSLGANLVVGTSFNILDGKLYVDYSALDLAKYNKVSVGYKFGF